MLLITSIGCLISRDEGMSKCNTNLILKDKFLQVSQCEFFYLSFMYYVNHIYSVILHLTGNIFSFLVFEKAYIGVIPYYALGAQIPYIPPYFDNF